MKLAKFSTILYCSSYSTGQFSILAWYKIVPKQLFLHRTRMLDRDDADDFVEDLLEEWYAGLDKIIYDNYIQRQLVPYTIMQAKDAILQIIEVCCILLNLWWLLCY